MDKVQPNEIRIVLDKGILRNVGLGKGVPRNLRILLTDFDVDGNTPEDDFRIEDNGYGQFAYCMIFHEPGVQLSDDCVDEDGTVWL